MTLLPIVLVDDDLASLQCLQNGLAPLGECRTVAFADPREALAWCMHDEPGLVITGCKTEGSDSHQLIRDLRRRDFDAPILILTASTEPGLRHQALALGATDYLLKPIDPIELRVRTQNMLELGRANRACRDRTHRVADEVRADTAAGRQREREAVLRFAHAAESRGWQTGSHVLRVAEYSRIIARQLGLSGDYQEAIELAALLHDVGNIGIPDRTLAKHSELTSDEMTVMRRHTAIGHQILAEGTSAVLQMAARIALTHHERHDGSGYPAGSSGESIPIEGRIVSIADVFDALSTPRPYKPAWSLESSIQYIELASGCLFDPASVAAFKSGLSDVTGTCRKLRDQVPGALPPDDITERAGTARESRAPAAVTLRKR